MKKNKGITLIALVITIIVLLILAGVAIAMLSGENGILKKAAEAKIKTKEVQEDEETALIDMELNTHFIEKNARYRCSYGYITGVTAIKDGILGYKIKDKVSDLQKALPSGYIVKCKYEYGANYKLGEDKDITEDIELMTGMGIVKEENEKKIVARVVIFGDVNCSGTIDSGDLSDVSYFFQYKEEERNNRYKKYQLAAININCDEYIDQNDNDIIVHHLANKDENPISQNKYVYNPKKIIFKDKEKTIKEYMNSLSEDFKNNTKYSFEKIEDSGSNVPYVFKGLERGTMEAGNLIAMLPEGTLIVTYQDTNPISISNNDILKSDEIIDEDFVLRNKKYKYGIAVKSQFVGYVVIACFE